MIRPDQVNPRLSASDLADLRAAQLEEAIDEKIRVADERQRWPATIPLGTSFALDTLTRVAQSYREAGWTVKLLYGGRQGAFIEIDRPPPEKL